MIKRVWRIAFIFVLSAVLLLNLGSALGAQGWLWASVVLLSLWILVVFFSDLRMPQVLGGKLLEGQDPWGLFDELSSLCRQARLPLPKVYLFNSSTPTALCFGRSWRSSYLFLTEALLENLSREELRAVLALEVAKIKRLDILPQTLATGLTSWNLWMRKSQAKSSVPRGKIRSFTHKLKSSLGSLFKGFYIPSPAHLIAKFCVGSQNYFQADQLASEYVGGPEPIAKVLWKLESYSLNDPLPAPKSLGHLFVVDPKAADTAGSYFRPQPPVRKRIEHLVGHYPV